MRSDFNLRRLLRPHVGFVSRLSLVMLCGLIWSSAALAQGDKQKKDVIIWDETPKVVVTPAKKGRPRVLKPVLMVRWQLLGLDRQNREFAVDPGRELSDGDYVRLAVQVNQEGYLYLMKQTVEKDGKTTPLVMISSDVAKAGANSVAEVPIGCDSKSMRNGKCWWRLRKPAGREVMTVIFSRNQIPELAQVVRKNSGEEIYVGNNLYFRLTQESPPPKRQAWTLAEQKRKPHPGLTGEYITMVQNPNLQKNELLVERIEFTHK
ncbi:MAG TPA: hypothetical protein VJ302_29955 [Blastocatellia bacterium]|nr:hypothetical protein [Blastocatellia bacterium]